MKTMTPEERFERIERQLEFLSESQARLFSSIEKHDAEIAEHSAQIMKLADVVVSLARIVENQGRQIEQQGHQIEQQGRRTDERLNALINTVERYISNGRK